MVYAILPLALIGAAVGRGAAVLYRRLTKQLPKKDTSAAGKPRTQNGEDAAIQKQLLQLQSQLDNGLVTKEEYAAKKQEIWKGR